MIGKEPSRSDRVGLGLLGLARSVGIGSLSEVVSRRKQEEERATIKLLMVAAWSQGFVDQVTAVRDRRMQFDGMSLLAATESVTDDVVTGRIVPIGSV